MCTADGAGCALGAPGGGFASVADALRVTRAAAAYLNSPAAGDLDGPARGGALEQLGAITSLLGVAANGLLRRFDADYGHDADGYATAAAWLAAKTRLGRRDAKAAVRQMRLLARHPLLDAATATGAVTISWAREIAGWTGRIDHPGLRADADQILLDAATAGADLDDLKLVAQAAYEAWRAQLPDPDDDPRGRGFGDRSLRLETTLDGAGRVGGDLTPECAAAVTAVLEALGKTRGPEDLRTAGQRCIAPWDRSASGATSAAAARRSSGRSRCLRAGQPEARPQHAGAGGAKVGPLGQRASPAGGEPVVGAVIDQAMGVAIDRRGGAITSSSWVVPCPVS